jgi:thiol reductant ABC exporter CydC subunit
MKSILAIIRGRLSYFAVAILLSAFSLIASIGLLACSAWLISMASTRPPVLVLEVAIVSVRFFGLFRGVVKYASRIVEHKAALGAQSDLRVRIYENFTRRTSQELLAIRRGAAMQEVVADVETLQDLWLRIASPWLSAVIAGVAGVGIIYWLLPIAGEIVGGLFALACFAVPLLSSFATGSRDQRRLESEIFDQIMQATTMVEEAIIFGFDKRLLQEIDSKQISVAEIESRNARKSGLGSAVYIKLLGIAILLAIICAINGYHDHHLAGINAAVIILLPLAIFDGLSNIPNAFSHIAKIWDAKRVLERSLQPSSKEPDVNYVPAPRHARLIIKDFKPLLAGISLAPFSGEAKPGSPLIIRGRSGAGKSSVIHALIGFLDFTGEADLGGVKVRNLHPSTFTTMLQDDHIFATSIRENIKIGKPQAGDREIMQILEIVELTDLITQLPDGLNTFMGEAGYNFSGGEKQRIKLARMLLRNTEVFLLDEPFEYLDPRQAERLTKKVLSVLSTKTVIMVSHTY